MKILKFMTFHYFYGQQAIPRRLPTTNGSELKSWRGAMAGSIPGTTVMQKTWQLRVSFSLRNAEAHLTSKPQLILRRKSSPLPLWWRKITTLIFMATATRLTLGCPAGTLYRECRFVHDDGLPFLYPVTWTKKTAKVKPTGAVRQNDTAYQHRSTSLIFQEGATPRMPRRSDGQYHKSCPAPGRGKLISMTKDLCPLKNEFDVRMVGGAG